MQNISAAVPCPLCKTQSGAIVEDRQHRFFICGGCGLYFRDPDTLLDNKSEKSRYEEHNNDVHDPKYQKFVSPIVEAVRRDWKPEHRGLDFGAGTGPVISKLLKDESYQIVQYDPCFHNYPALLSKSYDYIVCCEVIEHFYQPDKEFTLLKNILNPGGKLYCMTEVFLPEKDFLRWTYKNDPTHVSIYQDKTFTWIQEHLEFSSAVRQNRLVTITRSLSG